MNENEIGISNLDNLYNLLPSDIFHFLKKDDATSLLLSYKSNISAFNNLFSIKSDEENLKEKYLNLLEKLDAFKRKFIQKEEVDRRYVSKEEKDNVTPSFLTTSKFESILAQYVTEDDLREKEKLDRQEAAKLGDEMTDFAGAAMIGINQSSAVPLSG